MDQTELRKKAEALGVLEASILSAHMKFFKVNSETYCHLKGDDFVLYDTVIRYFTDNSLVFEIDAE
ncbi:MAG: hypothetical protein NTZ24_16705 [Deltaproteobacteria bacterium]|nr:hypothetical protein [Deltaproteobacteria bacterium]